MALLKERAGIIGKNAFLLNRYINQILKFHKNLKKESKFYDLIVIIFMQRAEDSLFYIVFYIKFYIIKQF